MKSQFNLTETQEQRLHDVLIKYETPSGTSASKNENEKEKEIKAIIGEDNYKVYKEKRKDMEKESKSGMGSSTQKSSTPTQKSSSTKK